MGWKEDARRTIVSGRKDLITFEGYWVKVRKYSINAKDEINTATREVQKGIDKKALMEVTKKIIAEGHEGTTPTESEVIEMLTPEQLSALLESNSLAASNVMETKLRNGIIEHSFGGTSVADLAIGLLEYPDIANEILGYIEEFNRPLAKKTSQTSVMSPSGSIMEQTSTTVTSSQTEEILPNS